MTITELAKSGSPLSPPASDARLISKVRAFYMFAMTLGTLSTCKRATVGCLIVPPTFTEVMAIGYNGPPSKIRNDRCRDEQGNCGCVHAEANAVAKIGSADRGDLVLMTTTSPCEACAGLIINSMKVGLVIWGAKYRTTAGMELLEEAGVAACPIGVLMSDGK